MHLVFFDYVDFYRSECAYAYMKSHIRYADSLLRGLCKKLLGKMQTCGRSSHGTVDAAVDCLIHLLVRIFGRS